MQRILQGLVPLIEAEQWDEALLALEPVAVVDSKFTSTDRSKKCTIIKDIYTFLKSNMV